MDTMFTFPILGKRIFLLGMCLKQRVCIIGYYGLLAIWGKNEAHSITEPSSYSTVDIK